MESSGRPSAVPIQIKPAQFYQTKWQTLKNILIYDRYNNKKERKKQEKRKKKKKRRKRTNAIQSNTHEAHFPHIIKNTTRYIFCLD